MTDITTPMTLDEVRAERLRLEEARTEREKAAADAAELAAELRGLQDDQAWDAAVAEHGERKVARLLTPEDGAIILKRPNTVLFKAYQDKQGNKSEDVEKLVRTCVIYPEKIVFGAMLKEQPGLLMVCMGIVLRLAGFRAEDILGK